MPTSTPGELDAADVQEQVKEAPAGWKVAEVEVITPLPDKNEGADE